MWEVHSETGLPVGTQLFDYMHTSFNSMRPCWHCKVHTGVSTHEPRQTREGVCAPYLKDTSDSVCVNVLA